MTKRFLYYPVLLCLWLSPALAGDLNLSKVDEWGVLAYADLAVRDDLVYAAAGCTLDILSISDPDTLVRSGSVKTPSLNNLEISNNHLIGAGNDLLMVFDLTQPLAPVPLGRVQLPSAFKRIAVLGNHVYVIHPTTSGGLLSGITVVDISNPAAPVLRPRLAGTQAFLSIAVAGTFVYGSTGNGTYVFDVSNPAQPETHGPFLTANPVFGYSAVVVGSHLYQLHFDSTEGIRVSDISNPILPIAVTSTDLSPFDIPSELHAIDNRLWVSHINGVEALDITDPSNPLLVGYTSVNLTSGVTAAWFEGDRALLSRQTQGLYLLDVSDPAAASVRSSFDESIQINGLAQRDGVLIAKDFNSLFAFDLDHPLSLASETDFLGGNAPLAASDLFGMIGFYGVDFTDPTTPVILGRSDETASFSTPEDLVIDQDLGVVVEENLGLALVTPDATLPPALISVTEPIDNQRYYSVGIQGNTVLVGGRNALMVYDISDRTEPLLVSTLEDLSFDVDAIDFKNNLAALSGEGHLALVDLTDPTAPQLHANVSTLIRHASFSNGLVTALSDDFFLVLEGDESGKFNWLSSLRLAADNVRNHMGYAYVGGGALLTKIDLAQPRNPQISATLEHENVDGQIVHIQDEHAYILDGFGLTVVNISGDDLQLVSSIQLNSIAKPVGAPALNGAADPLYLKVITDLYVVDIADPANPTVIEVLNLSGVNHSLGLAGHTWYSAGNSTVISINDMTNPSSPVEVGTINASGRVVGMKAHADILSVYITESSFSDFDRIEFYDIANPRAPVFLGQTFAIGLDATMHSSTHLITNSGGDIQLIDLSNPANAIMTQEFQPRRLGDDVVLIDNYALISGSSVAAFEINQPGTPHFAGHLTVRSEQLQQAGSGWYGGGGNLAAFQIVPSGNAWSPSAGVTILDMVTTLNRFSGEASADMN